MCGLPCAGKTTLARRLEQEHNALRLTADEWMEALFGQERAHAQRESLEEMLFRVAERALALGVDVVVDFGVWSREEREDFRARAAELGARSELHVLEPSIDVLIARVAERSANLLPGALRVSADEVRLWATWFESPTPDERLPREAPGAS